MTLTPINTDPTNGRVEFYTINGVSLTMACLWGDYDATMATLTISRNRMDSSAVMAVNDAMINTLVAIYNQFQRITGVGDVMEPVKNVVLVRDTAFTALPFIRGVLSDPWLYAQDEAYQQAAVLGLHKAQIAVQHRIEHLTRVK